MDANTDNLKILLDKIRTVGFFERIFYWYRIKNQLTDAMLDLQKLILYNENCSINNQKIESVNLSLSKDLELSNASLIRQLNELENNKIQIRDYTEKLSNLNADGAARDAIIENFKLRIHSFETEQALMNQKNEQLQSERDGLKESNSKLFFEEENRRIKFENDIATLNSIKDQIQQDRNREMDERVTVELARHENLKETWNKHQSNVKNLIKNICNKHTIEYIEKVPFPGEPDNTLKICDEFVIFDAKSPANDDLTNFPGYLKDQCEKAKKYAKHDLVKTDIFFVVPANTLERLPQFVFNLADYNVFIIAVDSLEPIILNLKKIEEYEFAEQLSPEERDNICRVLGKFAHLTKRRIQIDSFFAKQFIELAYKSESDLPKDFFEKTVEFERSEKLNPPIEKRAKSINIKELEKEHTRLNNEALSKGIDMDAVKISTGINDLKLYTRDT